MRRSVLRLVAAFVLAAGLSLTQLSAIAAVPDPVAPPGTVLGHRVHVNPYRVNASQAGARNAAAPAGAQLTYYGGRVVSHVRTVGLLYGPGTYRTYVTGGVSPNMGTFLTGVSGSAYLSWLDGEYNTVTPTPTANLGKTNQRIGWGTYAGLVSVTPSTANGGTHILDSQVQSELSAQIVAGHLPAPQKDAAGNNNTDYVVYFPAGTSICIDGGGGCSMASGGFCAYHGTIANVPGYGEVYYTVMPDFTPAAGGCGTDPVEFHDATSVLSHELVETITDPEVGVASNYAPPLAWYDKTNGEIGDICNAQQGTLLGSDGVTCSVQTASQRPRTLRRSRSVGHGCAGVHQRFVGVDPGGVGRVVHGDLVGLAAAGLVRVGGVAVGGDVRGQRGRDGQAGGDARAGNGGNVRVDVDRAQRGRVGRHAAFTLTTPYVPGLLRVTTSPAVPSQISVDGVASDTWGLTWLEIAPGSHQVCFTAVQGFTAPGCQTLSVTSGVTTAVAGGFVARGFLKVSTSPPVPSQISVDGVPRDDWGVYTDARWELIRCVSGRWRTTRRRRVRACR